MPKTERNAYQYIGTQNPICPYCDYEQDTSEWMLGADIKQVICQDCKRAFCVETVVEYSFNTSEGKI